MAQRRWDPTAGSGTPIPGNVQAGQRLPYTRNDYVMTHAFIGLGQSASRELDPRVNRGPRFWQMYTGPLGNVYNPYPGAIQQETYRQYNGTIETVNTRRGGF